MSDSDEQYRRVVELSPDGIFITRDSRIVFVNPAAVRIFGASSADAGAGPIAVRLLSHRSTHPPSRSHLEAARRRHRAGRTKSAPSGLDGTVTDVEVACTLFEDSHGRAIQSVMRDITERKRTEAALRESEERLSLAFAGAQEGVWDWNLETGHVVYSARWKQMLGYDDDEIEPHVSAWERLLHPDDHERARELNARSRAASAPIRPSSGCATRPATTWTCSRAACRSAASPADPWSASSAPISI